MKVLSFIFVLIWLMLSINTLFSQSEQWIKQIGAKGYSLVADENNNFCITGSFENTAIFDTVSVTSKGQTDIFVSKYSSDGNLIWVKTAGAAWYDEGFSLVTKRGNIYVTGFMNNAIFEDTTIMGYPFFIASYNSSGNLEWAQSLSTGGGGGASSIAVDSHGDLYMTGSAYGLIPPDSLGLINSSFFIAKFDDSGNIIWIKGTYSDTRGLVLQPAQAGITCDINNYIYIAGVMQSEEVKFDSTHILVPEGISNVFVVKYDSIGNVVLAIQSKGPGQAYPLSVTVDTASNIYLTGCFEGSATFGDTTLESFGSFDIFTVKYDKTGTFLWVRQAGSTNYDSGRNIKVDLDGNVYVIGINSLSADFNDNVLNHGGAFLAKYDRDGNLIYLTHIFTVEDYIMVSGNNFTVNDFALVENKNILVTGFFNEEVYFNSQQVSGLGGSSIFVAKIKENSTEIEHYDQAPSTIVLHQNFPNPFNPSTNIQFSIPKSELVTLEIYNLLGQRVATLVNENLNAGSHTALWNATGFASGVYLYRLQAGNYAETKKLILLR